METAILSKRMIATSILFSRTEKLDSVSNSLEIFAAIHPSGLLIGLLPSDVRNLLNLYWRMRLHIGEKRSSVSYITLPNRGERYEGFLVQALKLAFGNSDITSASHRNRRYNDGLKDGFLLS